MRSECLVENSLYFTAFDKSGVFFHQSKKHQKYDDMIYMHL